MQRTTDNPKCTQRQADFALRVKVALLTGGLSMSDLARSLNLSRNTVSLAVNRGLYEPTRRRIAKHLKIAL
jgi:DNA-binding NarL/FixJ family response regulator